MDSTMILIAFIVIGVGGFLLGIIFMLELMK